MCIIIQSRKRRSVRGSAGTFVGWAAGSVQSSTTAQACPDNSHVQFELISSYSSCESVRHLSRRICVGILVFSMVLTTQRALERIHQASIHVSSILLQPSPRSQSLPVNAVKPERLRLPTIHSQRDRVHFAVHVVLLMGCSLICTSSHTLLQGILLNPSLCRNRCHWCMSTFNATPFLF